MAGVEISICSVWNNDVYFWGRFPFCACIQRIRPSHNINMINIICKQKLKSWRINIFETPVKLQADSGQIHGTRDSITIPIS